MIELRVVHVNSKELPQLLALYERAFPVNERKPLDSLLQDETGHGKIQAAYAEGVFAGFICLLEVNDMVHIIYFAVEETMRGAGIGSQILQELARENPKKRIIADIEEPEPGADNHLQRITRKKFYLRNGYIENNIHYNWRGTNYTILSIGGAVTEAEFDQFWDDLVKEMPESENY